MIAEVDDNLRSLPLRILVVEDSERLRSAVAKQLLKQPDLEIVGEAADGIEAVEKAEALKPDIVVMDVGLPKLNGLSAARCIRSASPNSRILFLTSYNDPQIVRAALDAGARGFVAKEDTAELVAALRAVGLGQDYFSKSVEGPVQKRTR